MSPHRLCALFALLLSTLTPRAQAAPAHDICEDLGPHFPFGISSYGAAGDWLESAHTDHGVGWGFVYVYILPPEETTDLDDYTWFIGYKADVADSVGAIPTFTFYQLLKIGEYNGYVATDHEADIVRQVMETPADMRTYFDNFVLLLETITGRENPPLVHVEPDSWGFMSWAMGVEGQEDASQVFVQVAGSGHPDLSDLPDDAGGLGQALLRLRDLYAPDVRLGWHASNFRVGTRPEVTADFYASMGDWDVLIGEPAHVEADAWWEPWDEAAVTQNLAWIDAVTASAGLPLIIWQTNIGWDYQLLGNTNDTAMLERFAEAGLAGVMFEHQNWHGAGDPDDFRAFGDAGDVPPGDQGGTAADLRERLVRYRADPVAWPAGSICDEGVGTGDDDDDDSQADDDDGADDDDDGAGAQGGCDCDSQPGGRAGVAAWVGLLCLAGWLRRFGIGRRPPTRYPPTPG